MKNWTTFLWRVPTMIMDFLMPPGRGTRAAIDQSIRCASFWQRLAAMLIDILVFVPLALIQWGVESASKKGGLVLSVTSTCLGLAYAIYGHGRFGKTVGKWVMGIRVVRLAGDRIGWRQAWLRSSVDVCVSILGMIGRAIAFAAIADSAYYGVGWSQRAGNLAALEPFWSVWAMKIGGIWYWSEAVTMLFNRRRRALHDYIAGTLVISERRVENSGCTAAEQAVAALVGSARRKNGV